MPLQLICNIYFVTHAYIKNQVNNTTHDLKNLQNINILKERKYWKQKNE